VHSAPKRCEAHLKSRAQWAIVGGIVAVAAVGLLYATNVIGGGIAPVEAGSVAPAFHAVTTTAGVPVSQKTLADYKGQVVVLNLWATWCGPCRSEMPSLEKLHRELGPKGLKIVAVSIDNPGMENAIRDFKKEFGLTFEILYAPDGKIQYDYQATGYPETFIIGRDGVIRKRVIAATDWSAEPQKALLRQLLAEPGS
jgi:cytochrome c biogenesis protein CcmG/thiol:disulfide interchange protein DsbE